MKETVGRLSSDDWDAIAYSYACGLLAGGIISLVAVIVMQL